MSTKETTQEEAVDQTPGVEPAEDSTGVLATNDSGDLMYSDADEDLDSEDSLTFSNGRHLRP